MDTNGEYRESVYHLRLLGSLCLSDGERHLDQSGLHSPAAVRLLAWLALHRGMRCDAQILQDNIWEARDENSSDRTLRNTVYRLRKYLRETWPEEEFVISEGRSYMWNPKVKLQTDTDQIEACIREAQAQARGLAQTQALAHAQAESGERAKQIALLKKALDLFSGKFLQSCSEHWVVAERIKYQNLYLDTADQLCGLYAAEQNYADVLAVSTAALGQDPLSDELNEWAMKSYLALGRRAEAQEHYAKVEKRYYEELGIAPPKSFGDLNREARKSGENENGNENLTNFAESLGAETHDGGAFACDRAAFETICRLESRRNKRLGLSSYMGMLTMDGSDAAETESGQEDALNERMEILRTCLMHNLRESDVVARCGRRQFILILSCCDFENAQLVLQRILQSYTGKQRNRRIDVSYSLRQI